MKPVPSQISLVGAAVVGGGGGNRAPTDESFQDSRGNLFFVRSQGIVRVRVIPARVVRGPHIQRTTRLILEHGRLPDPVSEIVGKLEDRILELEGRVRSLTEALQSLVPEGTGRAPLLDAGER